MARSNKERNVNISVDGNGGGGGTTEATIEATHLYRETVRLDPTLSNPAVAARAAVPNPAGGANLLPAVQIQNGNSFVLDGEWKSFSIIWNRETKQDAEVDINGRCYKAGQGYIYSQDLPGFSTSVGEFFNQAITFTAGADAYLEISIIRKV